MDSTDRSKAPDGRTKTAQPKQGPGIERVNDGGGMKANSEVRRSTTSYLRARLLRGVVLEAVAAQRADRHR